MKDSFAKPGPVRWSACAAPVAAILAFLGHQAGAEAPAAPNAPAPQQIGRMLGGGLVWIIVLLILSAAGLIAWLRFSRRLKQRLRHQPHRTDSPDIWPQHRLPPDWDDDAQEHDNFMDEDDDGDFLDDSDRDE